MNRDETKEIIKTIARIYPAFHRDSDARDKNATIDLWASLFAEEPPELVAAALKAFIVADEKGFAPSPGQIKAKIRSILQPEEMTEAEAWQIVNKAIKNSGYIENARAEYEKLPDIIKPMAKPQQLREWALQDAAALQTVVASNFMRSFRERSAQIRRYEMLPADVKTAIESFAPAGQLKGEY
ncbi:MAG: replicative helicase loader/inhibitor [Eubacteriales bacterium]|nr:replicative helicase loader/inhibitor [Eubacteriales bacterium]